MPELEKPGRAATVTIYAGKQKGVLSVPSKALRFTHRKDYVGGMKIKDIANARDKVFGRLRATRWWLIVST